MEFKTKKWFIQVQSVRTLLDVLEYGVGRLIVSARKEPSNSIALFSDVSFNSHLLTPHDKSESNKGYYLVLQVNIRQTSNNSGH